MASLIQSKSAVQTGGAGTQVLAFDNPVQAHSTIIVVAGSQNVADTLTVSDGVNAYTAKPAIQNASGAQLYRLFFALNVAAGATSITVSGLGSPISFLAIHEFSLANAFDQIASASGILVA